MGQKFKKKIPWLLVFCCVAALAYLGYAHYTLRIERDQLSSDLDGLERKYKILQRKYAEEKAQAAVLQRAKLAVEGKMRQAQQDLQAAQEEKAELENKLASVEAEFEKKTQGLKQRIEKYAESLEKLKANRDQYKQKLAETVQIVKDRNRMIQELTLNKEELTLDLQEKTSELGRCVQHNARLSQLSEELITAYENKGVGDSLAQAEPFTQIKQVEIEHLVQLYRDRIDNENLELINQSK